MSANPIATATGAAILFLAFGPRMAMPYLLPHYMMSHEIDRDVFSNLLTVQALSWGLSAILFGRLADRGNGRRILAFAALIYACGLLGLAHANTATGIILTGGALVGIGLGGTTFAVIFSLLRPETNLKPLFLVTAGAAIASLVFTPAIQALLLAWGVKPTLTVMAVAILLILPLSRFLQNAAPATAPTSATASPRPGLTAVILLLVAGCAISGFQTGLVTGTFGVTFADAGLPVHIVVGAIILLNLANATATGALGMVSVKTSPVLLILGAAFAIRAACFALLLALPPFPALILGVAILLGASWLVTLPLSVQAGIELAGTRNLGIMTGIFLLSWQLGSLAAASFALETYGWWGHYRRGWQVSLALALAFSIVTLMASRRIHQRV